MDFIFIPKVNWGISAKTQALISIRSRQDFFFAFVLHNEILTFVHQKAVSLCCGIFKYLDETQQLKIRLRMPLNSINGPSFF